MHLFIAILISIMGFNPAFTQEVETFSLPPDEPINLSQVSQEIDGWVLQEELVQKLIDTVEANIGDKERHGIKQDDEAASQLAKQLLNEVHKEIVPYLTKYYLPETNSQKTGRLIEKFYKGVNPLRLGKWIIKQGRNHGPAYVATYAALELTEKTLMYLAVFYPKLLVLWPLMRAHPSEVITFGIGPWMPRVFDRLKVWKRYKNHKKVWLNENTKFLDGAYGYYEHVFLQRMLLPIDWDVVIDTQKFDRVDGGGSIEFAVVNESLIGRKMPRFLKIIFSPKLQAQKDAFPTISLQEIENLASRYEIKIKRFAVFKKNLKLYTQVLLREITSKEHVSRAFTELINKKADQSFNAGKDAIRVDVESFLKLNPEQLRKAADGEPLDVIAQRVIWYIRQQAEYAAEQALEIQPKGLTAPQRKLVRRIVRLTDREKGLAGFASTDYTYSHLGDWEKFYEAFHEAHGTLLMLQESVPLHLKRCQRYLLTK